MDDFSKYYRKINPEDVQRYRQAGVKVFQSRSGNWYAEIIPGTNPLRSLKRQNKDSKVSDIDGKNYIEFVDKIYSLLGNDMSEVFFDWLKKVESGVCSDNDLNVASRVIFYTFVEGMKNGIFSEDEVDEMVESYLDFIGEKYGKFAKNDIITSILTMYFDSKKYEDKLYEEDNIGDEEINENVITVDKFVKLFGNTDDIDFYEVYISIRDKDIDSIISDIKENYEFEDAHGNKISSLVNVIDESYDDDGFEEKYGKYAGMLVKAYKYFIDKGFDNNESRLLAGGLVMMYAYSSTDYNKVVGWIESLIHKIYGNHRPVFNKDESVLDSMFGDDEVSNVLKNLFKDGVNQLKSIINISQRIFINMYGDKVKVYRGLSSFEGIFALRDFVKGSNRIRIRRTIGSTTVNKVVAKDFMYDGGFVVSMDIYSDDVVSGWWFSPIINEEEIVIQYGEDGNLCIIEEFDSPYEFVENMNSGEYDEWNESSVDIEGFLVDFSSFIDSFNYMFEDAINIVSDDKNAVLSVVSTVIEIFDEICDEVYRDEWAYVGANRDMCNECSIILNELKDRLIRELERCDADIDSYDLSSIDKLIDMFNRMYNEFEGNLE